MLKNKIKDLIKLIEGTEIEEIEVSSFWGAQKIRLNKGGIKPDSEKKISVDTNVAEEIISSKPEQKKEEIKSSNILSKEDVKEESEIVADIETYDIKAPLVGTYYASPKPGDPPFINLGDKVSNGQTLCIIEAMKIFNEIESDISGTVHEICVEDGSPVEFDQLIIKISPE